MAKLNLSYTNIYAPQDGYVTNKRVEKGAYVQKRSGIVYSCFRGNLGCCKLQRKPIKRYESRAGSRNKD
ncbi:MAG: hypothetical protein L6V95_08505 [Candidatus Melainabacteria bacterium]|nr:MAG: hypothetical protein L6V95_08505 [Candidatus Melainabacteria bacterium]